MEVDMRTQIGYLIVESTDGITWSPIFSANTYELCKEWMEDEKMFATANLWDVIKHTDTTLILENYGGTKRYHYAIWDIDRLY